jgi:hypothetical protein
VRRVDNAVNAFRRVVEDIVPWYDRQAEQLAERRTQAQIREGEVTRTEARRVLRRWFRRE